MSKTITLSTVSLYISTLILTVSAQTTDPTNANPPSTSTLIGEAIAVVGIVAVFLVIGYAGYKMIRKWSSGKSD